MKKNKKIILGLITVGLLACAPKNIQYLEWKTLSPKDTELPKNYNSKTKIGYELSNDNTNLYLKILVNDESTKRQIMMSGMQVWIDTTKKYSENFGINFPLPRKKGPNMKIEKPADGRPPKLEEMESEYIKSQDKFIATSLVGISDGLNNLKHENGLELNLNIDDQRSIIYNAKIPLTYFNINTLTDVDSTKLFTLSIKIDGVNLPTSQSGPPSGGQGGPPGGGRGGQGGGPPGGGARPSGQGGPPSSDSGITEDKEVKFRFKLDLTKNYN